MIDQKLLQYATNEAIYWWIRDEYYYHKIFSNIESIFKEEEQVDLFTNYLFKTFARQYSVHRTINDFNNEAKNLLEFLNTEDYFKHVTKNEIGIIDVIASKLKGRFAKGKPISLLSKFAFLINPEYFSLYDKFARNSINSIIKSNDSNYSKAKDKIYIQFINKINSEIEVNKAELLNQIYVLVNLQPKVEIDFLEKNPRIFIRRIFDKYLWLLSQEENVRRSSFKLSTMKTFWKYYEI